SCLPGSDRILLGLYLDELRHGAWAGALTVVAVPCFLMGVRRAAPVFTRRAATRAWLYLTLALMALALLWGSDSSFQRFEVNVEVTTRRLNPALALLLTVGAFRSGGVEPCIE